MNNYRFWFMFARRVLRTVARSAFEHEVGELWFPEEGLHGFIRPTTASLRLNGEEYEIVFGDIGGDPDNGLDVEACARFLAAGYGQPMPGHFWQPEPPWGVA